MNSANRQPSDVATPGIIMRPPRLYLACLLLGLRCLWQSSCATSSSRARRHISSDASATPTVTTWGVSPGGSSCELSFGERHLLHWKRTKIMIP